MNKSYTIYMNVAAVKGAGEIVSWEKSSSVRAYLEPQNGEKLVCSAEGDNLVIDLIIYTKEKISSGERIYIPEAPYNSESEGWFEIRQAEFYQLPYISYFKGYLVKTDENIRI